MTELEENFDALIKKYKSAFVYGYSEYKGNTLFELLKRFKNNGPGVYVIWSSDMNLPVYIGSSGKISRGMQVSSNTVRKRLFYANTPYHFNRKKHIFQFSPTTSGVPPAGYKDQILIRDIKIDVFITPESIAPSVLEHLLIQGFINQHRDLPLANQKI